MVIRRGGNVKLRNTSSDSSIAKYLQAFCYKICTVNFIEMI
jgi:hypothetical protein